MILCVYDSIQALFYTKKNVLHVCLSSTTNHMSVWKSNFFLQTGLPESLPKPPERDAVADEQFAADHGLPPARRTGPRGPDKFPRKKRATTLFNFFETIRGIELRQADGNVPVTPQQMRKDYRALCRSQRSYWEYMHELFFVFERQQNVAEPEKLAANGVHVRKKNLCNMFYFLDGPAQQQLVRDHLAHRWQKENYDYVRETCHQDSLRHLVDIRRDLRLLLAKVEHALAPKQEPVPPAASPPQPSESQAESAGPATGQSGSPASVLNRAVNLMSDGSWVV